LISLFLIITEITVFQGVEKINAKSAETNLGQTLSGKKIPDISIEDVFIVLNVKDSINLAKHLSL
tara:strand:+ start:322 stop:516 length:195 start_codon:yes stop_codon:yes gene_type:complete